MPVSGLDFEYQVKDFRRLFRRWGSIGANLRGVFNAVLPVQIVDRFRGEEEGSIYALYAETEALGPAIFDGQHPAIVIGSTDPNVEIEILGFQFWYSWLFFPGVTQNTMFHMYTPFAGYNPIATLSPAGNWVPGMILNYGFHRSSAVALSGYNPVFPAYPGWTGYVISRIHRTLINSSRWAILADQSGLQNLRTPIRIPPRLTFAWQLQTTVAPGVGGSTLRLAGTILYREREYAG